VNAQDSSKPTTDRQDSKTTGAKGNTAVPEVPHDRVQMLSLNADGTPNQTPGVEIIGDPEFAKAAAREQFKQQAVSAADFRGHSEPMMTVAGKDGETELVPASEAPQDPSIKAEQDKHESLAKDAEKAADAMVDTLHKDAGKSDAKS
jgi:hypothetical protein